MPRPRPIIVASDLSPASDAAVTRGLQLAGRDDRPVIALHAIHEEPLWWVMMSRDLDPDTLREDLRIESVATLQRQVEEAAGRLGSDPGRTDCRVRFGKPAPVLSELADETGAATIVVGAHGRHAVRDWFVGTTAEKMVRSSRVPVLVTRAEPTHAYQQVVVAVDFSESSRAALAQALLFAPDARYTLVHAYETWFETYISEATYERLRRDHEEALLDRLREFGREGGLQSRHEPEYRVEAGHPGRVVIEAASRVHADLTVCGTQGATGLRHLLLGSVAQHVLREARSDVLTVHAPVDAEPLSD